MAKLIWFNVETCTENSAGSSGFLYFDEMPSEEEIKGARVIDVNPDPGLTPDVFDPHFWWKVSPSPISEMAGLVRIEVAVG
jgi:hypothetical protein